jgi:hypothetical protein
MFGFFQYLRAVDLIVTATDQRVAVYGEKQTRRVYMASGPKR